jgi:hypothetical protein
MKRLILFIIILLFVLSCSKNYDGGSLTIVNYSDKQIEFLYLTPEGELFPTSKSINVGNGETYEIKGLPEGNYDIALDFKNEVNSSINSKKNKLLCLKIEKGVNRTWIINTDGNIINQ